MNSFAEILFSGFVSEVISYCSDVSCDAVIKASENRNTENQNMQSKIYQTIIDALNVVTGKKYKDQDLLYDVAEKILNDLRNNKDNYIKIVEYNLDKMFPLLDGDVYKKFVEQMRYEITKEGNEYLYKNILLVLFEQGILNNRNDFKQIIKKLEEKDKVFVEKKEYMLSVKEFSNNKKQEYVDNWNSRLFLERGNKENQITLSDAFFMPNYKIYKKNEKIGYSMSDNLDVIVKKFINYDNASTMLITGEPGIGKSSIISWLANEYRNDDNIIILRFGELETLERGLLNSICSALECKNRDLKNKILILDGFDEMKSLNIGEKILDEFFNDILNLEKAKCIITSRPAYINSRHFHNAIKLLPFDIDTIEKFYHRITNKNLSKEELILDNLDVIGIPVILYMSIRTNIDITQNATKSELYHCVFAREDGIFERFSYEDMGYDRWAHPFRNSRNIKKYLKFLQQVAFLMFEKGDTTLHRDECDIPKLRFGGHKISILEFPIKHFFDNTKKNIEFIHRSIYEYFASEYIYEKINEGINISIEKLASNLGGILKNGKLSIEIIEFLKYNIKNSDLNDKFDLVFETFQLMLNDGMTYYTNITYKNVIECEMNVFTNMFHILHLWDRKKLFFDNIINFDLYLRFRNVYISGRMKSDTKRVGSINEMLYSVRIDLSGVELRELDLNDTNLKYANLYQANLENVTLMGANLTEVILKEAVLNNVNLKGAILKQANLENTEIINTDLRSADLSGIILKETKLKNTILDDAQMNYLKDKYDLKGVKVYIKETKEFIDYEKYCKRRK